MANLQGASILIADDDALVRLTLQQILDDAGYRPFEAKDGDEALELFRTAKPDLVMVDMIMPGRNGVGTLLELRRFDAQAKVIVMSGGTRNGEFDYLELTRQVGADAILSKPFNRVSVLALVSKVLRGSNA
jgi:two-component system, chemotaxis family, chemotaxis protein CheY